MSKLIYIHEDDDHLLDIICRALQENGYEAEYASSDITAPNHIRADITLICRQEHNGNQLTIGDITLDPDTVCAYDASGTPIHFTPIEFSMLLYLMKNAHRAVPRSELLSVIWGYDSNTGTRVADDTAKRLRRKLNGHTMKLETIWNYGFRVHKV